MSLIGPNGKPIDLSKAVPIGGPELNDYKIGEIAISTNETPETALASALAQVQGFFKQQMNFAAAETAQPFQFEPAALAVFMMLSNELKRLNKEIEALKEANNAGPDL